LEGLGPKPRGNVVYGPKPLERCSSEVKNESEAEGEHAVLHNEEVVDEEEEGGGMETPRMPIFLTQTYSEVTWGVAQQHLEPHRKLAPRVKRPQFS